MTELAKFAWTLVLVIFFVGSKAAIIFAAVLAFIFILYWLNPKWFWPE